ncbi:MAG TPA: phosphatase [Actinomycetota bacterium]|nr:phosphatase [Actinomycetota bacterium]
MSSDVIEAHVRRLPPIDERWEPRAATRAELERGLLAGTVAGWATHPLDNVRGNAQMLLDHDPDKEFGLRDLQRGMTLERILQLVETAAGAPIDREARTGPVEIRPGPIVEASVAAGERLADAARNGASVLLATGHPVGLAHLYHQLGSFLRGTGVRVLEPPAGLRWREPHLDHDWSVESWDGVAMLSDGTEPRHTHRPDAMERIVASERPGLVFADHGFAGAAIQAGIETISIADVNDPALLVARDQDRTEHVLVFDDHVRPQDYWPVFLALTAPIRGAAPA